MNSVEPFRIRQEGVEAGFSAEVNNPIMEYRLRKIGAIPLDPPLTNGFKLRALVSMIRLDLVDGSNLPGCRSDVPIL